MYEVLGCVYICVCVCVPACVPQWPPLVIIGDKIESSVFCVVTVIFYLAPMHSGGLKTSTYSCI
jgi:hypothetical protein